jgi:hypothetical protein
LVPLPLQYRFDIDLTPTATGLDPSDLNIASEYRITGLYAAGPVFDSTDITTGIDQNNTDIFVGIEWWEASTVHLSVWRYGRHRLAAPDWELVWSDTETETFATTTRPRSFMFAMGRTNNSAPTQSGQPVLTWVGGGHARMFPDEDDPGNTTTRLIPGDIDDAVNTPTQIIFPDMGILHQGRVVILPLQILDFGADSAFAHNEAMYWTAYNDFRTLDTTNLGLYGKITVGPEHPVGYSAGMSLSSNELVLIKRSGGAVLISGDVSGIGPSSPQARTLPYVKSAGLSYNNGCICPLGFIYPVDGGGVWLWQGGDFSQDVSKTLVGDFWRPPVTDSLGVAVLYGYANTQMDSGDTFTLLPNNYIFDSDHGSWWRGEDPAQFIAYRWSVDFRGRKAYATPSGFTTSSTPVIREYDLTRPAAKYVWQSQPISNTIENRVAVDEIVLVASGAGTITVKVATGENTTGQTVSFTINSTVPIALRKSLSVRGSHLQFTITSTSTDYAPPPVDPSPSLPAPSVYELRYSIVAPNPITHG